jgi:lipoprotein-anchoring transpeptidase ErfK/SrfK
VISITDARGGPKSSAGTGDGSLFFVVNGNGVAWLSTAPIKGNKSTPATKTGTFLI